MSAPFRSPYPGYDVLDKRDTPSWNPQTRAVVDRRLREVPGRRFLTAAEWTLLTAIVDRLVPQPDRNDPVPIVPWIDAMLAEGQGPGFRYADMPPMAEAWRRGLAAIATEAEHRHGAAFERLTPVQQDALLEDVQHGRVDHPCWDGVPPGGFFTHLLLRESVAIYYAHPAAWSEIGFGGPASPRGYVRLGFDERDPWEAEEADD
jgi:hypothetical protein